jgi:hypothetical protein
MKRFLVFTALSILLPAAFLGSSAVLAEPWKFGVMGDTQWTLKTDPAGQNPNGVPVSIISQVNQRAINGGVKFVIQVGDLTQYGNDADVAVRARAAQALYDAGIGFFPMRGNHETYAKPDNGFAITAIQSDFPQTKCEGAHVFAVTNCSSPALPGDRPDDLKGVSYSFDYGDAGNSARFVIIGNWAAPGKKIVAAEYLYGYSIGEQQAWITSRIDKNTRNTAHAFVFSHQPLMAENHQDSPFIGYTDANPAIQNDFFASLASNGVKHYISGHDHVRQRSIVASPDGASRIYEQICASNSSKFYTPKPSTDAKWYGQKVRETPVSQELYTVGLVGRNERGRWIRAVAMNVGGTKHFVLGPYRSKYELGTYGIDVKTRTAWAVVNYAGDFAIGGFEGSKSK